MARFADFEINGERLPAEFFLDWAKVHVNVLFISLRVGTDIFIFDAGCGGRGETFQLAEQASRGRPKLALRRNGNR